MSNKYSFLGGAQGMWQVAQMKTVRGPGLEHVERINVVYGDLLQVPADTAWVLHGFTSNVRYAVRTEVDILQACQPELDRPEATCAALIPIKKSARWWALPQDERRQIFEETSHHTAIGVEYLPAIARRLHHCRDIAEPFDFLTWFEYAAEHSQLFEDLVLRLRATKEWDFVEREIDIRLTRIDNS